RRDRQAVGFRENRQILLGRLTLSSGPRFEPIVADGQEDAAVPRDVLDHQPGRNLEDVALLAGRPESMDHSERRKRFRNPDLIARRRPGEDDQAISVAARRETLPAGSVHHVNACMAGGRHPNSLWGNATRSPLGETRGYWISPVPSPARKIGFPMGYSRVPLRTTAIAFPSGAQSAHWTSVARSRGAPPAMGTLASVPGIVHHQIVGRPMAMASSPVEESDTSCASGMGTGVEIGFSRRVEKT